MPIPRFIKFLLNPALYQAAPAQMQLIETHISWVILTGKFAYKIKKPVNFGFLDFSSLEKRKFYCEEELRLNQRTSNNLYLEVVRITKIEDHVEINGSGPTVEYAVKMRQFSQNYQLDELLKINRLDIAHIKQLAQGIAKFHASTTVCGDDCQFGEADRVVQPILDNFSHIREIIHDEENLSQLLAIEKWVNAHLTEFSSAFSLRKQQGHVRECHGDLHLRNIALIDEKLALFDCIEFNENLRWIDTMSEIAFILMDLEERGAPKLARVLLNEYLSNTGDYSGLNVLTIYQIYRALVRAKVACLQLAQVMEDAKKTKNLLDEYHQYVNLAEKYTQYSPPIMIIMFGTSGSGKSTVAEKLIERSDIIWIRSDIERKRLFELSPEEKLNFKINEGIYSPDRSKITYEHLLDVSEKILNSGFSVLIDATFLKQSHRQPFIDLAIRKNISWFIVECKLDLGEQKRRVIQRARENADPSDATVEVLEKQLLELESVPKQYNAQMLRIETKNAEQIIADLINLNLITE